MTAGSGWLFGGVWLFGTVDARAFVFLLLCSFFSLTSCDQDAGCYIIYTLAIL